MGAVEQTYPESIDEILAVVKETPRGRWFLEGFEKRLRSSETERILNSISKLEAHVQSLSGSGHDGELLQKARDAIAAARRDIASIEQRPAELSAEGQLFAKLAALSKQSFSGAPAVSKGVERALRLVSDLDHQLGSSPTSVVDAAPAADFFKPDDAIFEPAPPPPAVASPTRNDIVDVMPRGAKLVIQHKVVEPRPEVAPTKVEATIQQPAAHVESPFNVAKAAPNEPSSEIQHSRIVIIRRKAEDLEHVPLLEPSADASASAA